VFRDKLLYAAGRRKVRMMQKKKHNPENVQI